MTKRRRLVILAIGIVTGIFLTACAGAATGQWDSGSGVVTGGSLFQLVQAPAFETTTDVLQVETSFSLGRPMELSRSAQALHQLEMIPGHFCMRGDEG